MKRNSVQRTLKYGIAIFISVLALSAGLSSSHHALAAQGSPKPGGECRSYSPVVVLFKSSDNKALTAPGAFMEGGPVVLETARGRDDQSWSFIPVNSFGRDCVYQIAANKTGKVLTAVPAFHGGSTPVVLSNYNGRNSQLWSIVPAFGVDFRLGFGHSDVYSNYYKIVSSKSRKVLDALDASVFLSPDIPGPRGLSQSWYIAPGYISPSFPGGPGHPSFPGGPVHPGFPGGPVHLGFPR